MSNEHKAKDQKPDEGFQGLGSIIQGLTGSLFPGMELPEQPKKAKPTKQSKAPKPSAKLVKAAIEISERPDETEAAYMARELVQCTLPHRDPKTDFWVRRNGDFALGLQAPKDLQTGKSIGLPYGSIPRLILLWIVTEAVRSKSRHIKLGDTLNDFLRDIGLDPNTGGGKRSDAARLKEQLVRLLRCRISFEYSTSKRLSWRDMQVADEGNFWWDYHEPDQTAIFESHIELGEKFFKAITAAPVPLDLRALIPLKQSPLAIDLYTWATYRLFTMQRKGDAQIIISFEQLSEQFGTEYTRLRDFKAAFGEAMAKVQQVFPSLDYTLGKDALILRDRKARPAIAPTDKTAAQKRLAEARPFDHVSDKTRAWFKAEFPRYDVDAALSDFYAWREDAEQPSANSDRHFKAFARTWVSRNS